jgi:hypothetical protein
MAYQLLRKQLLFRTNRDPEESMPSLIESMPSLLQVAKKYGAQAVRSNAALPALAISAANAVALGRASADDAGEVYLAYLDSVMTRSTAQSLSSRKAQVSKLRQIMLLAEEQPAHAPKLLVRVERMHRELTRETPVKSLYAAMVGVARAQRNARKQLSADELRACIAK